MEYILLGIVSGIITGLGMGGGSILILVLVSILGIEQHVAQTANMYFYILTAIVAISIHWHNENIDKTIAKKLLFPIIVGSIFGSYLATQINSQYLKIYFGIFLLIVGIYETITTLKEHLKKKEDDR